MQAVDFSSKRPHVLLAGIGACASWWQHGGSRHFAESSDIDSHVPSQEICRLGSGNAINAKAMSSPDIAGGQRRGAESRREARSRLLKTFAVAPLHLMRLGSKTISFRAYRFRGTVLK